MILDGMDRADGRQFRTLRADADEALADLDASVFRVRFDRPRAAKKLHPRAMAKRGPGPHRSGDIAETLRREGASVAPVRAALIVYSPAHGDTAFTVPLSDGFMRRIMPGGGEGCPDWE